MTRRIIITVITLAMPAIASAAIPDAPYRLTTAMGEASGRISVPGQVWSCHSGECSAPHTGSRDNIVCARAARKLGTLTSFKVGDRSFSASELAQCNAAAAG